MSRCPGHLFHDSDQVLIEELNLAECLEKAAGVKVTAAAAKEGRRVSSLRQREARRNALVLQNGSKTFSLPLIVCPST